MGIRWLERGAVVCVALLTLMVQLNARENAPLPRLTAIAVATPDATGLRQVEVTVAPPATMPMQVLRTDDALRVRFPFADPAFLPSVTGEARVEAVDGAVTLVLSGLSDAAIRRDPGWADAAESGRLAFALYPVEIAPPPGVADIPLPSPRPATLNEGVFTVMIDPGHGGYDPGAAVEGFVEKRITLIFARRLAARIAGIPGMRPLLTRSGDRFVPLGERQRLAVAAGADVFLSIHADTVTEGNASGLSVYTLDPAAEGETVEAIATEAPRDTVVRGLDLGGQGDDVARILVDLAQRRSGRQSRSLADHLLADLGTSFALLPSRPHRHGNFRVLRTADVPAVLIELGFLSSAADRERLDDRRWQARLATEMAASIDRWRQSLATKPGQR
ncbi:MAG: N-acetylmuramoyl-L-alanine amidase [Pseudomonadota bacterium]